MKNQTKYFDLKRKRDTREGYLFLMPAIIAFVIFIAVPIIASFVLMFFKYNLIQPAQFVGLTNIQRLFVDPMVKTTLGNTFKFLVILVPIHCLGGLVLAYFVFRVRANPVKTLYRGIIYFPSIVTTASVTIVWSYMFATDTGLINYYVRQMGLSSIPWMTDKHIVFVTIALFSFWKFIGTAFLYYFIGLQNIPSAYYEAASIDGANSFQSFFRITLPLLSPTIFFVMITNIIGVFQIFDEPFLLTNGGPGSATRSFSMYIYETGFVKINNGYGSVMATVLFLIILAITIIQFTLQNRWVVYDYE